MLLKLTYIDFRFYAASWKNAQSPAREKYHFYHTKLMQLSSALPSRFTRVIEKTNQSLNEIIYNVPWVLTHSDLSNMNILVDPDSGHLTGVVDWADAGIEPFGTALWGLESVLGSSGPDGWSYFGNDVSHSRRLFRKAFLTEIGKPISHETRSAIDKARTLGVLLRYGFSWEDGTEKPTGDTSLLDVFLKCESKLASKPFESHSLTASRSFLGMITQSKVTSAVVSTGILTTFSESYQEDDFIVTATIPKRGFMTGLLSFQHNRPAIAEVKLDHILGGLTANLEPDDFSQAIGTHIPR